MKKEIKKGRKEERKKVFVVFAFLGCCVAFVSLLSQTFRDKLSFPSSRINLPMNTLCSEFLVLCNLLLSVAKHTSRENFEFSRNKLES